MLNLPDVTLVAVDTANQRLALRALERSREGIAFGRVLMLTDALPASVDMPPGIEMATIRRLASRSDYSAFVLKELLPHVTTTHALLVQWDGYVINPSAWEPAFLDCDYIGAKWFWQPAGRRVGNGGFSLRSRRLLEALQDSRIAATEHEDLAIGDAFRDLLESRHAIRYADEAMADRFAFEAAYPIARPFGFHGLFNFCRVVPEEELVALAGAFSDAIARSPQFGQLIRNCSALAQWRAVAALARRRLAAVAEDGATLSLLQQAETALQTMSHVGRNDPCPCGSGKRFKQCHGAIGAPVSADALAQRGMAAHQRGDLESAERDYRATLERVPDHPLAMHYLGVITYQRGHPADALPLLERAVALVPAEAEFHNNLGLACAALDLHERAIDAYRRALDRNAHNATAWNNLGLALTACNRLDEAIAALRSAVALRPDFGEAHWNLALALLANGDFAEGWREYEWRLQIPALAGTVERPSTPRWRGEALHGKTLLLSSEQGLGDTLMFIRFAKTAAARGARVIAQVPKALMRLVATAPGVAEVCERGQPAPRHDVHLPLPSIMATVGVDLASLPVAVPYLRVDETRRRAVVAEIGGPRYKIGIAWSTGRHDINGRRRSCPLAVLAPLFDSRDDVAWFSLQTGEGDADIASVSGANRLVRLDARNDFDGTAALIEAMDLVISIDTSIVHLAGALARPTWTLLPCASDWRWGATMSDSPWYPTLRLFRQPADGDWTSVAATIRSLILGELRH